MLSSKFHGLHTRRVTVACPKCLVLWVRFPKKATEEHLDSDQMVLCFFFHVFCFFLFLADSEMLDEAGGTKMDEADSEKLDETGAAGGTKMDEADSEKLDEAGAAGGTKMDEADLEKLDEAGGSKMDADEEEEVPPKIEGGTSGDPNEPTKTDQGEVQVDEEMASPQDGANSEVKDSTDDSSKETSSQQGQGCFLMGPISGAFCCWILPT